MNLLVAVVLIVILMGCSGFKEEKEKIYQIQKQKNEYLQTKQKQEKNNLLQNYKVYIGKAERSFIVCLNNNKFCEKVSALKGERIKNIYYLKEGGYNIEIEKEKEKIVFKKYPTFTGVGSGNVRQEEIKSGQKIGDKTGKHLFICKGNVCQKIK